MDASPLIDPQITQLVIGDDGVIPFDQGEWMALGECIGSHENLQELTFWAVDTTRENLEGMLTSMNQNRTVRKLKIYDCFGEWLLGILAVFFQQNENLTSLEVESCGEEVIRSLSAALQGCTSRSLEHIACTNIQMGDEVEEEFIEALAGLPHLDELDLDCDIGRRGCGAVAALLRRPACMLQKIYLPYCSFGNEGLAVLQPAVAASSTLKDLSLQAMDFSFSTAALQSFAGVLRRPDCMLKYLDLGGNSIGDDEIISFADALATNRTLEELSFQHEHTVSGIGFAAMTRALCNTSSIGDVHSSNHTLHHLWLELMPDDIHSYLHMNENENKSLVAREKIFMHFFEGNYSMEPFHENNMSPNILPHLLSWFGRTPDGFTALFSFLRRMPPNWGNRRSVLRRSRRKRKVRD